MVSVVGIPAQAAATAPQTVDNRKTPAAGNEADRVLGFFKAARDAATAIRVDFSNQRKGRARQRVEDLKKRIADLMLAAMASPKGVARAITMLARQLGDAAKDYAASGAEAQPAGETRSGDAAVAAYQRSELHFADDQFAADLRRLHGQLKAMLEFELRRAADEAANKRDDQERDDIAHQFSVSSEVIEGAAATIGGWHQAPAIPPPLAGAVDVKV